MERNLLIFKDGVLQARKVNVKAAMKAASPMVGDIRIVDARKPAVVVRNVVAPSTTQSIFKFLNGGK